MPPRSRPLPTASTPSARAARAAFLCDLCGKQYTRQNELEAHESSYDHLHKKRLKEMKSLQGKMAGRREREGGVSAGGLVRIELGSGGGGVKEGAQKSAAAAGGGDGRGEGKGFRKGGFRNAFAPVEGDGEERLEVKKEEEEERVGEGREADSDFTDEEDYYDPRRPTGCYVGCPGRVEAGAG